MEHLTSYVRKAAVAGRFYPASRSELEAEVESLTGPGPPGKALGAMVPHAGYIYSGGVAGEVFGQLRIPEVVVILGPNHTGVGPPASLMNAGVWRMPGGDVLVDTSLAQSILSRSQILTADETAHIHEHSIEVQLPFLQHLKGEVRFVPICLMIFDNAQLRDIGLAIAQAVREESRSVLIIASSDMSHYESQESAQEKDSAALACVLELDPEGLLETVATRHISMCGAAPTAAMLYACRELGAREARLTRYATSGDVTGDYSQVVGYAGVIVT